MFHNTWSGYGLHSLIIVMFTSRRGFNHTTLRSPLKVCVPAAEVRGACASATHALALLLAEPARIPCCRLALQPACTAAVSPALRCALHATHDWQLAQSNSQHGIMQLCARAVVSNLVPNTALKRRYDRSTKRLLDSHVHRVCALCVVAGSCAHGHQADGHSLGWQGQWELL